MLNKKNNILHSKNMLVLFFLLIIGPIYAFLIHQNPIWEELSLISLAIYFLLTFFIFYIIYLVSVLIEIILLKIFLKMPLKYVIIYPFTMDKRINFNPIKLTMNQEPIRDVLPLNLIYFYKKGYSENELRKKFKNIISINTVSCLLSYSIIWAVLEYSFELNFMFVFVISFTGLIGQTLLSDGYFWKGTRYILSNESVIKYLLTFANIEELTIEDYATFLEDCHRKKPLDLDYLYILENYLYECINNKKIVLPDYKVKQIVKNIFEHQQHRNVIADIQRINMMKLIGLVSKVTGDAGYHQLFQEYMSQLIDNDFSSWKQVQDPLIEYASYIEDDSDINRKKHYDVGRRSIFSYREDLEKKIINFKS